MISIAFVGLCLTSTPNLINIFRRPLRSDAPLASYFPAWIDSSYGPVVFSPDEAPLTPGPAGSLDVVARLFETHVDNIALLSEFVADDPSVKAVVRTPVSFSLPSALKDFELDEVDEWNYLAAHRSMDDLLVYRPNVELLSDILEEDEGFPEVTEDADVFSFAGFSALQMDTLVPSEFNSVSPVVSGLRADAPIFLPVTRVTLGATPPTLVSSPILRPDAAVFTPSTTPVPGPSSPLLTDAPEFKSRNALALAYEARRPSDASASRDALELACAARIGFITPRHVLHLETPVLNKDAPVFVPRATSMGDF